MLYVLLAAFIIMLASLAGVFSVWKRFGTFLEKHLSLLVSFSAGVFLIVSWQLGSEVLEEASSMNSGLLWILFGAVLVMVLFRMLPYFHHHHDEHEEIQEKHSHIDGRRVLFSDAVHNVGDGILLAASFSISITLGFLTTIGIFVHELVQEISEFFVLRQAGYSTKGALKVNFLVSSTILIGALGSFFLLEQFEILEVPLLGIAAGAFLVVVFFDLIPHSVRNSKKLGKYFLGHLAWFIVGALLML
ncbi:MAG: ZIP family metal transporter, partial [Candidatus Harrisonbacteria bacterium]|nr:ZIP family metal transporter [Candidatus Harrisonbacteria bacterium]